VSDVHTASMATAPTPDDLRGLWVPLITPFDDADRVDLGSLARLCRRVVADGARGVVALGTTGEPAVLDADERREVVVVCAEVCGELGAGLVVGAGTNSTRGTIDAVVALADVPHVTAALTVVPYYTRPSAAAIVDHYRSVAAHSPVPVIGYNIPYRTGRGLDARAVLELAAIDNVVGLKQSVGALDVDTLEILRAAPPGFHLFAGDDAFIGPTVLMGGAGAIAAAAHVCTRAFADLIAAALDGDVPRARRLAERLLPVVVAGVAEPSPACWKAALHASGEIPTAALRAPMGAASEAASAALLDAIAAAALVAA
jgi:4-hydroxy-tetrahydrodipicolinate synthase